MVDFVVIHNQNAAVRSRSRPGRIWHRCRGSWPPGGPPAQSSGSDRSTTQALKIRHGFPTLPGLRGRAVDFKKQNAGAGELGNPAQGPEIRETGRGRNDQRGSSRRPALPGDTRNRVVDRGQTGRGGSRQAASGARKLVAKDRRRGDDGDAGPQAGEIRRRHWFAPTAAVMVKVKVDPRPPGFAFDIPHHQRRQPSTDGETQTCSPKPPRRRGVLPLKRGERRRATTSGRIPSRCPRPFQNNRVRPREAAPAVSVVRICIPPGEFHRISPSGSNDLPLPVPCRRRRTPVRRDPLEMRDNDAPPPRRTGLRRLPSEIRRPEGRGTQLKPARPILEKSRMSPTTLSNALAAPGQSWRIPCWASSSLVSSSAWSCR